MASYIEIKDLSTLVSAGTAKQVALNSPVVTQLKAVAYQINTQSNCGAMTVKFNQPLLPEVKQKLLDEGYQVFDASQAGDNDITLISWKGTENTAK